MARRTPIVAVVLVLTACRFLVSTDGLQGGSTSDAASLPDVTTPVDSGTAVDTGVPPVLDAGPDVPPPVPFCQARAGAHFCLDFDVAGQKQGNDYGSDGTLVIDSAQASSKPNSALISTLAGNANEYKSVRRATDLPKKVLKSVTYEFAWYGDVTIETGSNVELGTAGFFSGTTQSGAGWYLQTDGLQLLGYNKPNTNDNTKDVYEEQKFGQVSKNVWHALKIVFTPGDPNVMGGAGGTIVGTFDGVSKTITIATSTNVGDVTIWGMGAYRGNDGPLQAKRGRYDDIAVSVVQ
jgi:hypothetical protein